MPNAPYSKRYKQLEKKEIDNAKAHISFLNERDDIGSMFLPEVTSWKYNDFLPILLENKIEKM